MAKEEEVNRRAVVASFEREWLSAIRGELRRMARDPELGDESVGTQCRVAAAIVGEKLAPHSEDGKKLLARYRQQTDRGSLYSSSTLARIGGHDPRPTGRPAEQVGGER